jgi:thiol reductant ABC exporter CydD subunit
VAGPIDRRLARESAAARRHLATAGVLGAADAVLIVAQMALLATIIARSARHGVSLAVVHGDLIALAAVLAGRAVIRAGFELSGRVGATRVMSDLRGRLIDRLLVRAPGRRPLGLRTGELASDAVTGVDALQTYFAGYLPQLMLASVVPPAVLIWVAFQDPISAGILAASIPVLMGFMILIGKGTATQTRKRNGALSLLSAHFLDVVTGLETLRSYRRERAQEQTLGDVGERYRREAMATLRIAFMSSLVLELCAMIGTALVAATIGIELCGGSLTLQAGLTVLLLAPELYGPLREVGQQFHAAADGTAASERIFATLDRAPRSADETPGETADVSSAPGPLVIAPSPRTEPVSFDGVSFAYAADRGAVLQDVTFALAPGSTTVLRGDSGSGKSTIARLLLGFDAPTAGQIRCGRTDLRHADADAWRAQIAWLPQNPTLFTGTVADNVALGTPGAGERAIRDALAAAGALAFADALPDGLQTVIGEGGRRVSAGQRQRIALARALLRDAALLILDEPTAHVDPETAADVHAAIAGLTHDRTVLIIAHDRSLEGLADHTIWLRDGCPTDGCPTDGPADAELPYGAALPAGVAR